MAVVSSESERCLVISGSLQHICERSGMEESARKPECNGDEQSRPIFMSAKHLLLYSWLISFFLTFVGKNDPHIGVLAAFPGSGWGKLGVEIHIDLKGFAGH